MHQREGRREKGSRGERGVPPRRNRQRLAAEGSDFGELFDDLAAMCERGKERVEEGSAGYLRHLNGGINSLDIAGSNRRPFPGTERKGR
jgi:hypothetical protein